MNFLFNCFSAVAPITEAPLDLAQRCDLSECQLPYCFCSKDGTNIPKDLSAEEVSEIKSWRVKVLRAGKTVRFIQKKKCKVKNT